jgi:signal transduction histidine kinase
MREHVFDLFLANEPNKSPESAAGLFLSRAVVQRYGGSIEVESAPARGTIVRVLLPVSSEDVVPP